MASPCSNCYTHGIVYSEENCKECGYDRAIKLLKGVLLIQDGCHLHCHHCVGFEDGIPICHQEENHECIEHSKYEIDFNKVAKDYDIEL